MGIVATVRPDAWNFPLFVHVSGGMILVGGLLTAATFLAYARGGGRFLTFGYWSLVAISIPGWVLMRIGAGWIASKEGWDKVPEDPTWLGIGYLVADAGGVILAVALVLGGIGVYRLRQGKGVRLFQTTLVLSLVLLVAYVVAVWAMAGKPD